MPTPSSATTPSRSSSTRSMCERMSMTGCPHQNDISAPRVLMPHEYLTWPGVTCECGLCPADSAGPWIGPWTR
eukprot:342854-Prymnesium_polylepis.1